MSDNCMELSPSTEVLETAVLTWTVEGLACVAHQRSSLFKSSSKSEHKFFLYIAASNDLFTLKHIHLCLCYSLPPVKRQSFRYRVSLVDDQGVHHHTREYYWRFIKNDLSYCHLNTTNYIPQVDWNKFVTADEKVTIYCEVDILNSKSKPTKLETLLTSETGRRLSDFSIKVGNEVFPVHRAVLVVQSPVFEAMFSHADTEEDRKGQMIIEDIEPSVFGSLLKYIYSNHLDERSLAKHAVELLHASDKYQLDELKLLCSDWLSDYLLPETVCELLVLSDRHQVTGLKAKCVKFIIENANKVIQAGGVRQLVEAKHVELVEQIIKGLPTKN